MLDLVPGHLYRVTYKVDRSGGAVRHTDTLVFRGGEPYYWTPEGSREQKQCGYHWTEWEDAEQKHVHLGGSDIYMVQVCNSSVSDTSF